MRSSQYWPAVVWWWRRHWRLSRRHRSQWHNCTASKRLNWHLSSHSCSRDHRLPGRVQKPSRAVHRRHGTAPRTSMWFQTLLTHRHTPQIHAHCCPDWELHHRMTHSSTHTAYSPQNALKAAFTFFQRSKVTWLPLYSLCACPHSKVDSQKWLSGSFYRGKLFFENLFRKKWLVRAGPRGHKVHSGAVMQLDFETEDFWKKLSSVKVP